MRTTRVPRDGYRYCDSTINPEIPGEVEVNISFMETVSLRVIDPTTLTFFFRWMKISWIAFTTCDKTSAIQAMRRAFVHNPPFSQYRSSCRVFLSRERRGNTEKRYRPCRRSLRFYQCEWANERVILWVIELHETLRILSSL